MIFILGLITGLLLALFVLITELVMVVVYKKSAFTVLDKIESKIKQKGVVFYPQTEDEIAREKIIETHDKQGIATPFEKL